MDKTLLRTLLFFSLVVLNYSTEHDVQHLENKRAYDLIGLVKKASKRLQDISQQKDLDPLKDLKFPGIDGKFEFKPNGLLAGSKCLADIEYTFYNLGSEWGLKLLDSFGKPESGILLGNTKWVGDYDECIGVEATNPNSSTIGNFKGKYCSLTFSLSALNLSIPLTFTSGVCVPDSCSDVELQMEAFLLLQMAGISPTMEGLMSNNIKCKPKERPLTAAAITMISLLSIFSALIVLGSSVTAAKYFMEVLKKARTPLLVINAYESNQVIEDANNILKKDVVEDETELLKDVEQHDTRNGPLQKIENALRCFCVFTNGAKLLNTDTSEGELLCIHGIRFLSMTWVILGHTYVFGIAEMKNMLGILPLVDSFAFQVMLQAFFSVDSFFVLSGFLLTYLFMKDFSKNKGKMSIGSWVYFYAHRYIRLTPMYMILLGFSASVYFYMGSGPYWPDGDFDPACRDTWWRNLLYINNFDLEAGQCMGWSWYLANDMQFFIISPLFLITLWRWPIVGYAVLGIFLLAHTLCNFFITYHFDLGNGMISLLSGAALDYAKATIKFADYFKRLYVKPYTRIGPYLVGILAGFLLFKRKAAGNHKHSLVFLTVGWIVATTVTLATVYGLYHRHPSEFMEAFYNAFNRTCFAAGLAWVIYVCLMGQGGPVNSILSFKLFIPLSRLTYAAYLIHPMIITGYFQSLRTSQELSHPTIVALFLGFTLATFGLALPVALMLESPIVSLEKLIRKQFIKK